MAKTTSVINLGYELAHNSKVLIIDTDGRANCSRFFTDKPKAGLDKALTSVEVTPEKALCKTRYENIDIVTATAALNRATVQFEKLSDEEQEKIADKIISFGSDYDYVLLDMPPALSQMTERLVSACDTVFIPIELGTFSIQGIPTVTSIVSRCGAKFGGCFVTKFERKNSADRQLLEQLKEILGNKTLNSKIQRQRLRCFVQPCHKELDQRRSDRKRVYGRKTFGLSDCSRKILRGISGRNQGKGVIIWRN